LMMDKTLRAVDRGFIVEGWNLIDYLRDAVENEGWESICIWGPKGAMKSNLMLQLGYLIYQDWDVVLDHVVFKPEDFIRITEERGRIPWMGWDDIGVWLSSSLYFTNRKMWSAMKENWDAFRVKLSTFICTAPRKDKVASFIVDDLSGEVLVGKRVGKELINKYDCQRWIWETDFKKPDKCKFDMVRVDERFFPGTPETALKYEADDRFNHELPGVPAWVFRRYYEERRRLAEEARERLKVLIMQLESDSKELLPKELAEMTEEERRSWAGKILGRKQVVVTSER